MTESGEPAGAQPGDEYAARVELMTRAYEAANGAHPQSYRAIAIELGVSLGTVQRLLKEYAATEIYAELLDRQYRRMAAVTRLDTYRQMALEEWHAGGGGRPGKGGSFRELIPALMMIEKHEAEVLGYKRPIQVDHRLVDEHGEAPDTRIVDAFLAQRERRALPPTGYDEQP